MSYARILVYSCLLLLVSCSSLNNIGRSPSSLVGKGSCQKILKRIFLKKSYFIDSAEDVASWGDLVDLSKRVNWRTVKDERFATALFQSPYFKETILDNEAKEKLIDGLIKYTHPDYRSYSLYEYLVNITYKDFSSRQIQAANTYDEFFQAFENLVNNHHRIMHHESPPTLSEVDFLPPRDYFNLNNYNLISKFNKLFDEQGASELTQDQVRYLKLIAHHSLGDQDFRGSFAELITLFQKAELIELDINAVGRFKFLEDRKFIDREDLNQIIKYLIENGDEDRSSSEFFEVQVFEKLKTKAKTMDSELEAVEFIREISQYFGKYDGSLERYAEVLNELPFIKNLTERGIPNHVLKEFMKYLSGKNIPTSYFAEYFQNLLQRLLVQEVKELENLAPNVNSTLSFLDLLNWMARDDRLEDLDLIKNFLKSPWGQRSGLSLDEAKALFLKIKNQNLSERQDLVQLIKEEYPAFALKEDNLLNFSRADYEIQTVGVKNQCQWGACWAYAGTEGVEIGVAKNAGEEIPLSTEYLYLQYVITKSQEILEFDLPVYDILKEFPDGGTSTKLSGLIRTYGMIPTEFLPRELSGFSHRRNVVLKKVQEQLESAYKSFRGLSGDELKEAKRIEQDRLRKEIESLFGNIPREFEYNGTTYTPQGFLKKFFPQGEGEYDAVTLKSLVEDFEKKSKKVKKAKEAVEESFDEERFRDLDGNWINREIDGNHDIVEFTDYMSFLKQRLDAGEPLYLSYDLPKGSWGSNGAFKDKSEFVNDKTGEIFLPKGKAERSRKAGHAVLAVGYEVNLKGEIEYVKVLNSWGTSSGDRGYYYIHRDYLEAFANTLYSFGRQNPL